MPLPSDKLPWATIMLGVLVAIAAIAGAVVVVVHGESLSFEKYLDLLKNFAIAVGILGVGRGIVAAGKSHAEAKTLDDQSLLAAVPSADEWRSSLGTAEVEDYPPPEPVGDAGEPATASGRTIDG
jgi:hypothetical protein